ncbi:SusC/RagA family TonB-linked outer membrane protein [Dinghuibacter silviterrae]|nr:SusC/RagA family TonB-linked outer membrane protein [Dinghuibacter silviterrae]
MRKSAMLLLCLLGSLLSMAQNGGIITGKVTGPDGSPIPGATVKVKGKSKGTVTIEDGTFQLRGLDKATLVISALGYGTQEVEATNGGVVSLTLAKNTKSLEEVVVTAIGVKKEKRELTFSSQEVSGADVTRSKEPNILNGLTGKVSGVQITNASGTPGGSARIVIRGITSILGNDQALIVLDGTPINNDETGGAPDGGAGTNRLSDIDPNIIESINVLKGAAATALYGSAGARGVVLITTKHGTGKPKLDFTSEVSADYAIFPERQYKYAQGDQGVYYDGNTSKTSSSWGPEMDTLTVNGQKVKSYNPLKQFFRTGITTNNSLQLTGGTPTSNYLMSYSYFDQTGTVPKDEYKRHAFFVKYSNDILPNLKSTIQLNYTYGETYKLPEGYGLTSPMVTVMTLPVSWNPLPYEDSTGAQRLYRYSRNNPYWIVDNVLNTSVVNRFIPMATFVYTPFSWLTATERVTADIYSDQQDYHVNTGDIAYGTGYIYNGRLFNRQYNHDFILQAKKQFGDFNTSLLLGDNIQSVYNADSYANGKSLSTPGFYNISNASSVNYYDYYSQTRKVGYYSEADVDWRNTLVLALSGRVDGSSVLKKTYFPYGSAALGYIFSENLPQSWRKTINFAKARVSYAVVGNDNVGAYANTTEWYQASVAGYLNSLTFPYNGSNGFQISSTLGNQNLKNELLSEFEAGLEMKLFDNRVGLEASYFNRKMTDGLVNGAQIAYSTGYTGTTLNSATMTTNGVEALVNVTPVRTRTFSWDMTLNWSKINNKVTGIVPGTNMTDVGFVYAVVGQPWGVLYGSTFDRTASGQLKINASGLPYSTTTGIVGNITPNWTGGIMNTFRYKQLALTVFIDIKKGGQIENTNEYYDYYYGIAKVTENRQDRVVAGISDVTGKANTVSTTAESYYRALSSVTEAQIQNDSYTKLRNVSLSYALRPGSLARTPFRDVTFTLTGKNLIIWHGNFTGGDPETNSWGSGNGSIGNYSYSTPSSRSVDVTLKLGF